VIPVSEPDSGGDADPTGRGVDPAVLVELFAVIEDRREHLPEGSYTASLFTHDKGEDAVLEKIGEETTELLLAAKNDDTEAVAHEGADLIYHLLVLLAMQGMDPEDLLGELDDRR